MNRFRSLITVAAFSLAVLCLPAIATAQWGGYGNNGGYGNGQYGGYGNGGYYGGDMRSVIRDLKDRSKDFQRQIDRDLDNSRYNGSYREDQLNRLAQDFRNAVSRLDSNNYRNGRYDNRNDYRLQEVFNLASQIERTMGRSGLSYNSQNIWQRIRYDLQQLNYNGGYNNRNNRRNNGTWGNGNRNGLPSWWPF